MKKSGCGPGIEKGRAIKEGASRGKVSGRMTDDFDHTNSKLALDVCRGKNGFVFEKTERKGVHEQARH